MYSHYGRSAEWELRDMLQEQGCYVIRSAASKLIDLIAIYPDGRVKGIEVKSKHDEKPFYLKQNAIMLEQLAKHLELSQRIAVSYCVRFGKTWREYPVVNGELPMILRVGEGNAILPPNISL